MSKVATAGTNGQFRTPRHIIKMMVELVQPNPDDVIIDPAMGSAGFLIEAQEYLRKYHEESFYDEAFKEHFANHMFYGNDMDRTMLRIGAMNMLLHGVDNPNIFIGIVYPSKIRMLKSIHLYWQIHHLREVWIMKLFRQIC